MDHYVPLAELEQHYTTLTSFRLQPTTLSQYQRITLRYIEFCTHYQLSAFPLTTRTICLWITHLHTRCSPNTIRNYLAAVGDHCKMNGIPYDSVRTDFTVTSLLHSLDRQHDIPRKQKSPITINHLDMIFSKLDHSRFEHLLFWAYCTSAFFGLLRLGELCFNNDHRRHILLSSLTHLEHGI